MHAGDDIAPRLQIESASGLRASEERQASRAKDACESAKNSKWSEYDKWKACTRGMKFIEKLAFQKQKPNYIVEHVLFIALLLNVVRDVCGAEIECEHHISARQLYMYSTVAVHVARLMNIVWAIVCRHIAYPWHFLPLERVTIIRSVRSQSLEKHI